MGKVRLLLQSAGVTISIKYGCHFFYQVPSDCILSSSTVSTSSMSWDWIEGHSRHPPMRGDFNFHFAQIAVVH